jgi:RHS repeat-associated protein
VNRRVIVKRDQNSSGDGLLTTVTNYDQLYRVALTQQLENATAQSATDLTAGIKVQTRYLDQSPNSYRLVSNPYRAGTSSAASSEATMGWTLTTFDQNGRAIQSQSFSGASLPAPWGGNSSSMGTVQTAYAGAIITVTDQAGNVKTSQVDGLSRLKSVSESPAAGETYQTAYVYDVLDDLTNVTQSSSGSQNTWNGTAIVQVPAQTRAFGYDSLKRVGYSSNPESGAINYHYDANGNVVWRDDNAGRETCYSYDPLDRITAKVYYTGTDANGSSGKCSAIAAGNLTSTTPAVKYAYDSVPGAKGSLAQVVTQGVSTTTYSAYDALGRVTANTQTTAGQSYPFSYSYNLAGAMTMEVYPSGRVVRNSYDGMNRTVGVAASEQTVISGATYAAQGGLQTASFANGLNRIMAYNGKLQPDEITDSFSGQGSCANQGAPYTGQTAFVMDLQLFWGPSAGQTGPNNGNLYGELIQTCNGTGFATAANFWEPMAYDRVNRLITFSDNGGGTTNQRNFSYDAFGNMWAGDSSGSNFATSASMPTSQSVYINSNGNTTNQRFDTNFSYDAAGNEQSSPVCTSAGCIQYDFEERQIAYHGATAGTYAYDGDGHRIERTEAGITTVYVYDTAGGLAAEYSSATSATTEPCTTCYLSTDHLGSIRMVTSQSGTIVARHDYMPFGEEIPAGYAGRPTTIGSSASPWNAADGVSQRFTGKERDAESGLDYFGARYMSSSMGRFMSPDPLMATPERLLDPQEWNMYGYARNNPLSITDPTGLDIWLQGCGANSSTCQGNYVGTTDDNGNFSRTHLTGDQTGDASIGTNGISVTQGGNTYQGTWDTNAGEQGAVLVGGAGDLSSFNANIVGNCQGTCVASGVLQNKDGTPATADALRNALTNPDGSAKSGWFANGNDPFHRHGGTNDTSFNAMNPDTAGQRSTDVTVPQTGGSLDSRFHVNSGYPFEDAYQMTRHVISIMHTFMNAAGITHPTTQ